MGLVHPVSCAYLEDGSALTMPCCILRSSLGFALVAHIHGHTVGKVQQHRQLHIRQNHLGRRRRRWGSSKVSRENVAIERGGGPPEVSQGKGDEILSPTPPPPTPLLSAKLRVHAPHL